MNKPVIIDYNNYLTKDEKVNLEQDFKDNFKIITKTLNLEDDYPEIKYYLYPTEEIKIQEMGEDGYAETDRENHIVYMVYNEDIKPIGPHELVHILTNKLGTPNYVFNEGLAEYFEDYWKANIGGKPVKMAHDDWVRMFVQEKTYVSMNILFDDYKFWEADETAMKSYPESGSFFKYLVSQYGLEKILEVFEQLQRRPKPSDYNHKKFKEIIGKSVKEVEEDWLATLG